MSSYDDDAKTPIPPDRGIVKLDAAAKARNNRELLRYKADPRIPNEIWLLLQEAGEQAAVHLHRLLHDPVFAKRKIHEQIRLIELAFLRSYGAPEAAFRRPPEEPVDPAATERGDSIRRLANRARLPEFSNSNKTPVKGK